MDDNPPDEHNCNKRIKYSSDPSQAENFSHEDAIRATVEENRKWIITDYGRNNLKNPARGLDFSIMTYNILSQKNLELNSYLYKHCDAAVLDWSYRAPNLLNEIERHNVDVICLQEIEEEHYADLFKPRFESLGYWSIFKKKTGNQNDGCAVFFKTQVFNLVTHVGVEFRSSEVRVLDRHNIGLIVVLTPKSAEEDCKLCIATTHLVFNPKRGDVKLSQLRVLLAEIDKCAFRRYSASNYPVYYPTILCGDMNSAPFSPLYNFITCGSIHFKDMKTGSVSGQYEGFNRGSLMRADDLALSPLGINDESHYKQFDDDRYKAWLSEKDSMNDMHVRSCSETYAEIQKPLCDNPSSSNICKISASHCIEQHTSDVIEQTVICDVKEQLSAASDVIEPCTASNVTEEFDTAFDFHEQPDTASEIKEQPDTASEIKEQTDTASGVKKQPSTSTGQQRSKNKKESFSHHLKLMSSYKHLKFDGQQEATIHNYNASCTVDYIFYSVKYKQSFVSNGVPKYKNVHEGALKLLACYGALGDKDFEEIGGIPNSHLSSDHTCLISRFLLKF